MNIKGLYEGLRDETDKNEELADAASFFIGLKKEAYGIPCSLGGESPKGWINQFEGSPLMQQALALERQELQMESEDLAKRQQERADMDGRMQADQQRWDLRDQIRIQKRELELQFAEQSSGMGVEESALPKHEAGMTTSDVAPASGGAEPPATVPGTGMPKMAASFGEGLKHIGKGMGRGALIGGAAGGVAAIPMTMLGIVNGKKGTAGERFKKGLKAIPYAALAGAGIGASFGGGHNTAEVVWDEIKKRETQKTFKEVLQNLAGANKLKNAMVKLGYKKTAAAKEVFQAIKNSIPRPENPKKFLISMIPAAIGGVGGGLYMHSRSKPRKELKGKSRDEVFAEENLAAQKANPQTEDELGLSGKVKRRMTEAGPGIAKALREHPIKAGLAGAALGSTMGSSIKPALGLGVNAYQEYQRLQHPRMGSFPG